MLTPQEVAEHTFKAHFGGYPMAMVDEFLDMVTEDYTTLYKENTALKAKMKVLADKVEDYRSTEEAMRKALLSAQKMADQMVAEAQVQKDEIVSNAEQEAAEKIAAIHREIESEQLRLTAARNATAAYIAKLQALFENEREYLASLAKLQAEEPKPDTVADAAQAIGAVMEKTVEAELPIQGEPAPQPFQAAEAEEPTIVRDKGGEEKPAQKPGEEEPLAAPPRIDFQNLQFGKDYEIG